MQIKCWVPFNNRWYPCKKIWRADKEVLMVRKNRYNFVTQGKGKCKFTYGEVGLPVKEANQYHCQLSLQWDEQKHFHKRKVQQTCIHRHHMTQQHQLYRPTIMKVTITLKASKLKKDADFFPVKSIFQYELHMSPKTYNLVSVLVFYFLR